MLLLITMPILGPKDSMSFLNDFTPPKPLTRADALSFSSRVLYKTAQLDNALESFNSDLAGFQLRIIDHPCLDFGGDSAVINIFFGSLLFFGDSTQDQALFRQSNIT
jgi:hypothetical protein